MSYGNTSFRQFWVIISFIGATFAQPDLRFHPFDFVQYRKPGQVNSISFSDQYVYIGTHHGGVQRFNIFSNRFEEPITRAQGLKSNSITAVHRATNGVLWVATPFGVEHSYDEAGNWRFMANNHFGFFSNQFVERIGESNNYIWLDVGSEVRRIDPLTGVQLGIMPNPDEPVQWSSGLARFHIDLSNELIEYSITDGWMTDLHSLFNPDGRQMRLTTYARNRMGELWIGTEDGTFFRGDPTMKTFTPYHFGLGQVDIQSIGGKDSFWIGGLLNSQTDGITYFDSDREISDIYVFEDRINMDPISIFSILELKKEVWFGGEDGILVYHKKKEYWRNYGLSLGGGKNWVTDMIEVDGQVWIGSPNGLALLNIKDKQQVDHELINQFNNVYIHDLTFGNDLIFMGTETGLFIFDTKNQKLYDGESFGYKPKEFIYPVRHDDYTAITQDKGNIYIANRSSILKFNLRNRQWSNAVDASIYGGIDVKAMAVDKNTIFISTVSGITKYEMNKHLMDIYNYPFIGQVNDMYIHGRKIWMGTSEGLTSYRYK